MRFTMAIVLALASASSSVAQTSNSGGNQQPPTAGAVARFSYDTADLLPNAYWAGVAVRCNFRAAAWSHAVLGAIEYQAGQAAQLIWGAGIYKKPEDTGSGDPEGGMNLTSTGGLLVLSFNEQAHRVLNAGKQAPDMVCTGLSSSDILSGLDELAAPAAVSRPRAQQSPDDFDLKTNPLLRAEKEQAGKDEAFWKGIDPLINEFTRQFVEGYCPFGKPASPAWQQAIVQRAQELSFSIYGTMRSDLIRRVLNAVARSQINAEQEATQPDFRQRCRELLR